MRGRFFQQRRKRLARLYALGGNEQKAAHGTACEIHEARMRLLQRIFEAVFADAEHEVLAHDPRRHVALHHEGDTAEHLPFGHVVIGAEDFPDARGEGFAIGHLSLVCVSRKLL